VLFATQEKIVLKKIPTLQKNKNTQSHNPRQTMQTDTREEGHPLTAPTKNWRFSASYDSFVVQQTFILRMNIVVKIANFL